MAQIGKELEVVEIRPVELPAPLRRTRRETPVMPSQTPERKPDKVPVGV